MTPPEFDEAYYNQLRAKIGQELAEGLDTEKHPKAESYNLVRDLKKKLQAEIPKEDEAAQAKLKTYYEILRERIFREQVINNKRRPDGRPFDKVRDIWVEVGVLPRTHGSAIFTRGETQALVTTTLGTSDDKQRLETFEGEAKKRFLLHYNFPPVLGGGGSVSARGWAAGDWAWGTCGAGDFGDASYRGELALHHAGGLGHFGVEWVFFHGYGLRGFAFFDGCGRAVAVSGGWRGDGVGEGRERLRHPYRHRRG